MNAPGSRTGPETGRRRATHDASAAATDVAGPVAGPGTTESAHVDVCIRLESPSPPTGEAGVSGDGDTHPFVGWLDLLRVLSDVFQEHDRLRRDEWGGGG